MLNRIELMQKLEAIASDIFIDEKIPMTRRRVLPLVVTGSEVVWAVGLRQSERFKVGKGTKEILRLQVVSKA